MPLKNNCCGILLLLGLAATLSNNIPVHVLAARPRQLIVQLPYRLDLKQSTGSINFLINNIYAKEIDDVDEKSAEESTFAFLTFSTQQILQNFPLAGPDWVFSIINVPLYLLYCFLRI